MRQTPVIIEAAINGATPKSRNPNVPLSDDEIVADALACFDAGAAIVHHHVDPRGSIDDHVRRYLACWEPIIARRPDALLYPTVHFGPPTSYEHLVPLAESGLLRVGLTDPGSVNLGGALPDGTPTGSFVYANSFDTIRRSFDICRDHGLGPSIAIYEPGFLRTALAWWRSGTVPQGAMLKLYFAADRGFFGSTFGLPPTVQALDMYVAMLADCDLPWAVSVVGGDVCTEPVSIEALRRGGHLHVGLEFYGGDRTPTNVQLVENAVALCKQLGYRPATPDEAAALLDLPQRSITR